MKRSWWTPHNLGVAVLDRMGRAVPSRFWKRILAKRLDLPLTVQVASTDACNLACIHCVRETYPAEPARKVRHMTFEAFTRLSDAIPHLLVVELDDRGEPLMHPDIFRMVRHVKAVSNGTTEARFNSNMMLLTRERAEEMVGSGLDALQISLDGGTKEAFEAIRVKGDFERVVENSMLLQEVKRRLGSATPRVSMNFVAMRSNVATLPDAVRIAARIGVDFVDVNGADANTERMRDEPLYRDDGVDAPPWEYAVHFREAAALARRHAIPFIPARMAPLKDLICQVALNMCAISWDGFVHPCSFLAHETDVYALGGRHHRPRLHFGNILERSLSEIWRSEAYAAYRRDMAARREPPYCRDCLVRQGVICHGIA